MQVPEFRIPTVTNLEYSIEKGLATRKAKDAYDAAYKEYLEQHPVSTGSRVSYVASSSPAFAGDVSFSALSQDPVNTTNEDAHKYAVEKSGYNPGNPNDIWRAADAMRDQNTLGASVATTILPLLLTASAGAFGMIPKLGADLKFAYDGYKNITGPEGWAKTKNFWKEGRYGRAAWSGLGDLFDASLLTHGVGTTGRFLSNSGKYAREALDAAKFNFMNRGTGFRMDYPWQIRPNAIPNGSITLENVPALQEKPLQLTGHFGKVKYYGPTMGKTTAAASNPRLIDFDDIIRQPSRTILDRYGFKNKSEMYNSGNQEAIKAYEDMLVKTLQDWRANPENSNLTLVASPTAIANPSNTGFYFDNVPSIPSRDIFITRNVGRGGTPEASAMWYDSLMEKNPNLKIDNRFVSEIEKQAYITPNTVYKSIFMEDPIMNSSKRDTWLEHSIRMQEDSKNRAFSEYNVQNFLNAKNKRNYLDRTYDGRYTVTAYDSFNRRNAGGDQRAAFILQNPVESLGTPTNPAPTLPEELENAKRSFARKYASDFEKNFPRAIEYNAVSAPLYGYSEGTILGPHSWTGRIKVAHDGNVSTPFTRIVENHEAGHATGNMDENYIYNYLISKGIINPDIAGSYLLDADRGEVSAHLSELPDFLGFTGYENGHYTGHPFGKTAITPEDIYNYNAWMHKNGFKKTIWDAINSGKMQEFVKFLNEHPFAITLPIAGIGLGAKTLKEKQGGIIKG